MSLEISPGDKEEQNNIEKKECSLDEVVASRLEVSSGGNKEQNNMEKQEECSLDEVVITRVDVSPGGNEEQNKMEKKDEVLTENTSDKKKPPKQKHFDFEPEIGIEMKDISPRKDGGIMKGIKKEGIGSDFPLFGDKVFVHYTGKLEDGTVFDSSRPSNQEFSFVMGKAEVIVAWEFGLATMKKNEIAIFHCHSDYAYRAAGIPSSIPPNANLHFEIEMLRWEGDDISDNKDGSILKSLLVKGETYGIPNDGADCIVHIIGKYNGEVFEDREVHFDYGEGSESGIVEGVETALRMFSRGEKARLKIQSHLAYGSKGCPAYNIPPDSDLDYEILLKECTRTKDFWDMNSTEKMARSTKDKIKGSNYFKAGNMNMAMKLFKKAVEFSQFEEIYEGNEADERRNLLLASQLNLALVHLKMSNPFDASQMCDRVLEIDPKNEKGLFRRAMANLEMKNYDLAVNDFKAVLDVNPENKLAQIQLVKATKSLAKVTKKEKETYYGMFQKFAETDKILEKTKDADELKKKEYTEHVNELVKEICEEVETKKYDFEIEDLFKPENKDLDISEIKSKHGTDDATPKVNEGHVSDKSGDTKEKINTIEEIGNANKTKAGGFKVKADVKAASFKFKDGKLLP